MRKKPRKCGAFSNVMITIVTEHSWHKIVKSCLDVKYIKYFNCFYSSCATEGQQHRWKNQNVVKSFLICYIFTDLETDFDTIPLIYPSKHIVNWSNEMTERSLQLDMRGSLQNRANKHLPGTLWLCTLIGSIVC